MSRDYMCYLKLIAIVLLLQLALAFSIEYNLNAASKIIKSPNYPNGYQNRQQYIWKITVKPGKRIRLTFEDIHFEENCKNCNCDLVEVYNGFYDPTRNNDVIATICSSLPNQKRTYTSSGNTIEVAFLTEYRSKAGRGVWFQYETVEALIRTTLATSVSRDITRTTAASSRTSRLESSIIIASIIGIVILVILGIFCCSLKNRLSRRMRERRSPTARSNIPNQHTEELGNHDDIAYPPMPNAPPTYEEAMTNSIQSIITPPPPYLEETNNNNNNSNHNGSTSELTNSNSESQIISAENEAYDSTGLPSYAEAHRLSQNSLDRL